MPRFGLLGFFVGSRIVLLIVLSAVLVWSGYYVWHFEANREKKWEHISVLEAHKTPYNALEYDITTNTTTRWIASAPSLLKPGQELTVLGDFKPFTFENTAKNTMDRSKMSAGYAGRVAIKRVDTAQIECSLICSTTRTIANFEYSIRSVFLYNACQNQWFVPSMLGISCQDVAIFSQGILIGGTSGLSKPVAETIRSFGLTHIVAVSGFQIVSIIALLEWIFSRLNWSPRQKLGIFSVILVVFLIITGPQAPIIRAMISFFLTGAALLFLGRKLSPVRALLYAMILMLAVNPFYLYSYSFWLSIMATLGVIAAIWICRVRNIENILAQGVLVSVGAYLATFGIVAQLNDSLNPASILANIILAPLVPLISLSALLSLIPLIGTVFAALTNLAISTLFAFLSDAAGWVSWSSFHFSAKFGLTETLTYYGFLAIIVIFLAWYKTILHSRKETFKKANASLSSPGQVRR